MRARFLFVCPLLLVLGLFGTGCANRPAGEPPSPPPEFLSRSAEPQITSGCVVQLATAAAWTQCASGFSIAGIEQQAGGGFVFVSRILCCPLSG